MSDLVKALSILLKYGDPRNPINCSHDELVICYIDPGGVSKEDLQELDRLGFFVDDGCFKSFRFGSC